MKDCIEYKCLYLCLYATQLMKTFLSQLRWHTVRLQHSQNMSEINLVLLLLQFSITVQLSCTSLDKVDVFIMFIYGVFHIICKFFFILVNVSLVVGIKRNLIKHFTFIQMCLAVLFYVCFVCVCVCVCVTQTYLWGLENNQHNRWPVFCQTWVQNCPCGAQQERSRDTPQINVRVCGVWCVCVCVCHTECQLMYIWCWNNISITYCSPAWNFTLPWYKTLCQTCWYLSTLQNYEIDEKCQMYNFFLQFSDAKIIPFLQNLD